MELTVLRPALMAVLATQRGDVGGEDGGGAEEGEESNGELHGDCGETFVLDEGCLCREVSREIVRLC